MKARYVYENVEFQRGRDPKTIMGLGTLERIYSEMDEDPDWEPGDKSTPEECLAWASSEGKPEYVRFLLDKGANPNHWGGYALSKAAMDGHTEVVRMLLDAGADPLASDEEALIFARDGGHKEIYDMLYKAAGDRMIP